MDVLFLPDYTDANPYQRDLRDALESEGVSVTVADGSGLFPVVSAARAADWPDVVHLHWLHPFLIGRGTVTTALKGGRLLVELLLLRLLGVQLVWTAHNVLEHERRAPQLEAKFKHVIVRLCGTVFVHCSSAQATLAETLRFSDDDHSRFTVVPHGNYIESYPGRSDGGSPKGIDLSALEGGLTFLYFGQIREYKNVPTLIDTFAELDAPDADLLVVGNPADEELRQRIQRRCREIDRVHSVLEFVPEEEVVSYHDLADVVVVPFEDVFTSGSVILAMSCGKPVVVPRLGCPSELLAEAGTKSAELTYDPDRSEGLAAAMRRSMEIDRETVGRQNRRTAAAYTWNEIATQTQTAYEQVATANGAGSSRLEEEASKADGG